MQMVLAQLLPDAPEATISALEQGIQKAGAVTPMLDKGMTPEEILQTVCGELGVDILEKQEIAYKCYCSRERVSAALLSLGRGELEEIISEDKAFPVECQFCDKIYSFTPEDIRELLKRI